MYITLQTQSFLLVFCFSFWSIQPLIFFDVTFNWYFHVRSRLQRLAYTLCLPAFLTPIELSLRGILILMCMLGRVCFTADTEQLKQNEGRCTLFILFRSFASHLPCQPIRINWLPQHLNSIKTLSLPSFGFTCSVSALDFSSPSAVSTVFSPKAATLSALVSEPQSTLRPEDKNMLSKKS